MKALEKANHERLGELMEEADYSEETVRAAEEYDDLVNYPTFQPKEALENHEIPPRDERAKLPLEVQRNLYSELRVPKDDGESVRFTKKLMESGPEPNDLQFFLSVGWVTDNPMGKEICQQDGKIRSVYRRILENGGAPAEYVENFEQLCLDEIQKQGMRRWKEMDEAPLYNGELFGHLQLVS